MTNVPHTGSTPRGPNGRWERTIDSAERDAEACRLRIAGWSYQRISDELGYGAQQHASVAVRKQLAAVPKEAAAELIEVEAQRLDKLQAMADDLAAKEYLLIQAGKVVVDPETGMRVTDDGPVLSAMKMALDIQVSRRRLLGLDAPSSVTSTVQVSYVVNGVDLADMI